MKIEAKETSGYVQGSKWNWLPSSCVLLPGHWTGPVAPRGQANEQTNNDLKLGFKARSWLF